MKIISIIFTVFLISGCAGGPATLKGPISHRYHRVGHNETLWRISKRYNVPMDALIEANRITNPRQIKVGQILFLPDVRSQEEAVSPFRSSQEFIWPLRGRVVSSFGHIRNRVNNKGIDIQINSDSNICASRDGRVAFIGEDLYGWGKTIIIDHSDGFKTIYAGVSQVNTKIGNKVARGDTIARIVVSENKAPCLHFEIRNGHEPKNPLYYLP